MTALRRSALRWADPLAIAAIVVHLALVLSLRVTAWPEVTTPAYLWSRGMLLYRDIKFSHTPGTMGTLALAFFALGVHTWVVRAYAIVGPLVAHLFVLKHTRPFSRPERALASLFFLSVFFSLEGNSVWPTGLLAALSLPIAAALSRGRIFQAGLLIGVAILFKQTAAYVLLVAMIGLAVRTRWREAGKLFLAGCLPYGLTLGLFAALGAGPEMLRWTLGVNLTLVPGVVSFRPGWYEISVLFFAFLPIVGEAILERPGEYDVRSRWLLVVALGMAAICYPRFDLAQTVGAVPCLAVGAARFLRRQPGFQLFRAAAFGCVLAVTVSRAFVLFSGRYFDGKVVFWNEEPALDALAARLRRFPRDTPLHSPLWENVLPRSGLLPPGRLYVNPFFTWLFPVDDVGERIQAAIRREGALVIEPASSSAGEVVGPYAIRLIKPRS
ncbi:MAG: hypothetical protein M3542_09260 [Acidobacteriota bacterium]|nr:hypothetical protein [Acidobacteriota bacterium]